jgi:hypothetical protein
MVFVFATVSFFGGKIFQNLENQRNAAISVFESKC